MESEDGGGLNKAVVEWQQGGGSEEEVAGLHAGGGLDETARSNEKVAESQ